MQHDLFVSYSDQDRDIIENLRGRFKDHGVDAWVYLRDRTLAADSWDEIEEKIKSTRYMLFACSENTQTSMGQRRELDIALESFEKAKSIEMIIPIVIGDAPFSVVPEKISHRNGERLSAHNVKSLALKMSQSLFPYKFASLAAQPWHHPIPGSWLEICNLDEITEGYFDLGDLLYFRQISPLGLFECYTPKHGELFWISPSHVKICLSPPEEEDDTVNSVPFIYSVSGWVTIQAMGWSAWHDRQASVTKQA